MVTLRFYFIPVRMAITNLVTKVGKNVGKEEPLFTVCWKVNQYNHKEVSVIFLKQNNKKIELPLIPSILHNPQAFTQSIPYLITDTCKTCVYCYSILNCKEKKQLKMFMTDEQVM